MKGGVAEVESRAAGEQAHPFVLAKRSWAVDLSAVRGAHELHPILSRLRDRLRMAGP